MRTTLQCVLIIGIVLVIIFVFPANHLSFSQNSTVPSSPIPTETIKIVKPVTTQNVSSQDELIISGQSSDNNLKNCSVTVIVNDVKPYQNAVAKGSGGATDFSEWEFVLHNNYTHINAGDNKITSKLLCASAPPRWYSVFVNGVPNSSNEDVFSPVQSEEQQNTPSTNVSGTNEIDGNNNELLVSISSLKNPVERGDTQNATITVTDSGSKAVANAEIVGKLIYPGNNYEKDFSGITDSQGKFVYSWIIGKKGDVGALSIEVEVSSQGYPPSSATGSFDIVDNS
ncbi:MAG: hypothetical protein QOA14_00505 [Nitrososphaeraceae archaeon]|nr:hypothetical protein [Nitrososphaeraceae archaeon]